VLHNYYKIYFCKTDYIQENKVW